MTTFFIWDLIASTTAQSECFGGGSRFIVSDLCAGLTKI